MLFCLQVIQGMLQAHSSVLVSKDNAAQLFAHEATRVFHDRLICSEDRNIFYQYLADNLHDYFKASVNCDLLYDVLWYVYDVLFHPTRFCLFKCASLATL